jgi:hypothetical protein
MAKNSSSFPDEKTVDIRFALSKLTTGNLLPVPTMRLLPISIVQFLGTAGDFTFVSEEESLPAFGPDGHKHVAYIRFERKHAHGWAWELVFLGRREPAH